MVPKELTKELIEKAHEKLDHLGAFKTTKYLQQYYFWAKMRRQVKDYMKTCDTCQRIKNRTVAMEGEFEWISTQDPNELATLDFYGPLPPARTGMQYILVVMEAFSKYTCLYPIKRATTAVSPERIVNRYIVKCGKPNRILSDHGSQVMSPKWKARLEEVGIEVIFSSIRHPQSSPTERVMRELGRLFRTHCAAKHTRWAEFIPEIEKTLNNTQHYSMGLSPQELHFGTRSEDEIIKIVQYLAEITIKHGDDKDSAGKLKKKF